MASDQVQMYHISQSEQPNDKENVILRTLEGDPNRHKSLIKHPPPTTASDQAAVPASMYTLESRYRPIPAKVLPKSTEPRVYYIDNQKAEQTTAPGPESETPMLAEEKPPQMVMLEPKIISHPVLYSIVGAKTLPLLSNQPVTTTTAPMPSPLFHTIVGQHQRLAANISAPTLNVPPPAMETSPILYNLVSSPRLQVRIKEPLKDVPVIPPPSSSSLYTVVGNPRVQPSIQEPIKATGQIPKEAPPILYSIVANPQLTSNMTYTNTPDLPPATQSIKQSSGQSVPILYTIVGETQVPNNISKANRAPLGPIKREANETTMYALVGNPNIPQSMATSRKTEPTQLQKQKQQLPPISAPTLFTVVGKPTSLPKEKPEAQKKPPARKKTPPRPLPSTRRISRSLDRQTVPEPRVERVTAIPPVKEKRQPKFKEPTIPKSETIFFPLLDNERTSRPKQPRTAPWHTSPEQTNRHAYQAPSYDPLQLPNYISPYAYHPTRPYRDRTVHPPMLPIIKNNRAPRKPRELLYEPRYRVEGKHPYDPWSHHSLERYDVQPKERPRLWDYEYEAQTDVDDDDDTDGLSTDRKRTSYRRRRPRTPWVPVW